MKKILCVLFSLLAFLGCRNAGDAPGPTPVTDDKDWYILRAPENREIQAVYGDIDGTLLITDRRYIYYTHDKGKTWTQADYVNNIGLAGFAARNDTLFVLNTQTMSSADPGNRYAIRPYYFSLNGGVHWQPLPSTLTGDETKVALNYAYSGNGARFSIDRVYHPNGSVEDVGVKSENGRKIGLPQLHVLNVVHFDAKSRLYVAGSAPLCEKGGYIQLCNEKDATGILYISKKAIYY